MCIATRIGAAGCIGADTLQVDRSSFECPVCIGSNRTETAVMPYYLAGSGLRRTPKIAWPLLLIAIQLKNLDSLVLRLVKYTTESNFALDKELVSKIHVETLGVITNISTTSSSYISPTST
jgi:hypothetical protein